MQKQNAKACDLPLGRLLNAFLDVKEPLVFSELRRKCELTRPCLSRELKKGERLGLLEKISEEEPTTHEPKISWILTEKGRKVQKLYKSIENF